ncbi:hypothetical protein [Paenibacillus aquistagni]|uniref:Uncharacterized protein n=1 Tax=Paenibacillus aquistagni TaxID=1852522 RepID=A0A1X7L833_9BACL|nr:hypothetical protein [Paenibacillus aquistagni]SMG49875.1 hypothetical protein SAMN06295960_3082 [Paenibacillus aquistagni]
MIEVEKIRERQHLRLQILERLYDIHFSGGPEAFSRGRKEALTGTIQELYIDNEHHKACLYLFQKN